MFVPIDDVYFHTEESVSKWNYVYHRRVAPERELYANPRKCGEIMQFLIDVRLSNIIIDVGPYYAKLVKECIVNLLSGFNNVEIIEYQKVCVIGHCLAFLIIIINEYLGV